jgi:hypothetical protein
MGKRPRSGQGTIGISTKQLNRWVEEKRIQRAKWKRPGGGPWINVYHREDVDRLTWPVIESRKRSCCRPRFPQRATAQTVRTP